VGILEKDSSLDEILCLIATMNTMSNEELIDLCERLESKETKEKTIQEKIIEDKLKNGVW
jgi:hypothetical protein